MHPHDLAQLFQTIMRSSRLVSLKDAAQRLDHNHVDCERMLDSYVADGVLRKATSKRGQTYYWLSESRLAPPEAEG